MKKKSITILSAVFIFLIFLIQKSSQIISPKDQHSSGVKTSYHRPSAQIQVHHNYSRVHHHNPEVHNSLSEDLERPHKSVNQEEQFPIYNGHTYGQRPRERLVVSNKTLSAQNQDPNRTIVILRKKKETPKIQIYSNCPPGETGQFVYELSCNQFLNCWKGRGYPQNCAPGTLFNPKSLECDYAEKVECVTGPRQNSVQYKRTADVEQVGCPTGFSGMIPNYFDCAKFINCVHGREFIMDCPPGTLFDISKNLCDHADKAICFNKQNGGCETGECQSSSQNYQVEPPACSDGGCQKPCQGPNCAQKICSEEGCRNAHYQVPPLCHGRDCANKQPSGTGSCKGSECSPQQNPITGQPHFNRCHGDGCTTRIPEGYSFYPDPYIACQGSRCSPQQAPTNVQPDSNSGYNSYLGSSNCQGNGCFPERPQCQGGECIRQPHTGSSSTDYFPQTSNKCQGSGCTPQPQTGRPCQGSQCFNDNFPQGTNHRACQGSECTSQYFPQNSNSCQGSGCTSQSQHPPQGGQSPKCPPGAVGIHKHPNDCSKFLQCANGITHIQDCAPGTLFNPQLGSCDFPQNVECHSGPSDNNGIEITTYSWNNGPSSSTTPQQHWQYPGYYNRNHSMYPKPPIETPNHNSLDEFGQYPVEDPQLTPNYYPGNNPWRNPKYDPNVGLMPGEIGGHRPTPGFGPPHQRPVGYYPDQSHGPGDVNRPTGRYPNQGGRNPYPSRPDYGGQRPIDNGCYGPNCQPHQGQRPLIQEHGPKPRPEGGYYPYHGQSGLDPYHGKRPIDESSYFHQNPNFHGYPPADLGPNPEQAAPNYPGYHDQRLSHQRPNPWHTDPNFPVQRPPNGSYYPQPGHDHHQVPNPDSGYHGQRPPHQRPNPWHTDPNFPVQRPPNGSYYPQPGHDLHQVPNPDSGYHGQRPPHQRPNPWHTDPNFPVQRPPNGSYYPQPGHDLHQVPNPNSSYYGQRPPHQRPNPWHTDPNFPVQRPPNGSYYPQPGHDLHQVPNPDSGYHSQRPPHQRPNRWQTDPNYPVQRLPNGSYYPQSGHGQSGAPNQGPWQRPGQIPVIIIPATTIYHSKPTDVTTPPYREVIHIDDHLHTTTTPTSKKKPPSYHPPQQTQVNDYDDNYNPNNYGKIVATTARVERSWPPPFPSTDVNADYVFEYDDQEVSLEAENPSDNQSLGSRNKKCQKGDFYCNSDHCIPKTAVCNNVKDCPNASDEMNCLEQLGKFQWYQNAKLAVLEKQRWDNVTIATCAVLCLDAERFKCKSFNYRKIDRTCFLTNTNIGLTGALMSYYPCDYYEMISEATECIGPNKFKCDNNKCIERSQICDGHDDCGDRLDEKGCKSEDIGYNIRLGGCKKENEGNVEVTAFGRTGYICDDQFSIVDANVVCKELGFTLGAAEVKKNSFYATNSTNTTFYIMDDVICSGNESSIRDCNFSGWGVHNCLGQEVAGVVCKTPTERCPTDAWQCDTGRECLPLAFVCDGLLDCTDGSDEHPNYCDAPTEIRLANGSNDQEGRVEIRHNGAWGTICDDDFNEDAAKVICHKLGFNGSVIVKKEGFFGPGDGPIWLDQVFCSGNETDIEACTHWDWGEHNCEHSEDVGVICSNIHEKHGQEVKPSSPPLVFPIPCGYRKDNQFLIRDNIHARVIEGSQAAPGDYPWQAAIRVKSKGAQDAHWCGAIIITEKFLLTAAHCLVGYSKSAYLIIAGDYDVDKDEGTEQHGYIEDFYIHENFRKGHKMNNDIALIKLKGKGFVFNQDVQPICLPDPKTIYDKDINCTISGFGSVKSGKSGFSHELRAGWIPLQSRKICTMPHVYGDALTDGMFCAGDLDGGTDACDGDSGGPLACLDNGVFTVYGITSWGQHCGYANRPGVYVKVAHYIDWINNMLQNTAL